MVTLEKCLFCARTPIEDIRAYASQLVNGYQGWGKSGQVDESNRVPIDEATSSALALATAKIIKRAYLMEPYTICGKNPRSWIGAAMYNSAKEMGLKITQKQIADILGTTSVTVRARHQDLDRMFGRRTK